VQKYNACTTNLASTQNKVSQLQQQNTALLTAQIEKKESTVIPDTLHNVSNLELIDKLTFRLQKAGFEDGVYRVEFSIENRGDELEYFQPSGEAILVGNTQYEVEYSFDYPIDTLSTSINPGVIVSGYWMFKNVPVVPGKQGQFVFSQGYPQEQVSFNVPLY